MKRIRICRIPHDLRQNPSPSLPRMLQFFQDQNPRTLTRHKPIPPASHGREAVAGSSFLVESARIAANPAIDSGVTAASLPPAIITSASPRSITRNDSPIA